MTTRRWWAWSQLVGLRAICVSLIALNSFVTRTRMSHENGIVARGRIRVVDPLDPAIPQNDFFIPGREFSCRLRHASVSLMDDAGLFVRAASLKFADADIKSPLDLLMNGGTAAPFWNMYTFAQFMYAKIRGGRAHLIPYFQANPRCFENVVSALRLRPDSFASLRYHTQTPFEFRARDGHLRYCKFRLLPEDRGPETGIPREDDLQTPWFQEARRGETLPPNYLKDEYIERVRSRGAKYFLEMQLHEWQPDDEREVILNSLYAWEESAHPWVPVANVHIDSIHEEDPYGYRCLFEIANRPDCIGLIEPLSIYDPPSLEYLRVGGAVARRARLIGTKLFGPPQPVPHLRPVVSYPDEQASRVTADDVWMDARLPQNETKTRTRERTTQLERARGLYQFTSDGGSPAYVKDLPAHEAFSDEKDQRMHWDIAEMVVGLGLGAIEQEFDPSRSMNAYKHFFSNPKPPLPSVLFGDLKPPLPSVHARYDSDEEFARQRLDGVNPFLLRRCVAIPDNFPVKQETVAPLLADGKDLASLRDTGRLYLLDLSILEHVPVVPGRFLCAPMCLFYVDKRSRLMPLAIQLGPSPDAAPIFTPHDDPWLWRTVKTHVQCADAQVQECASHLLRTHLVMETVAVAMHRQLSVAHPLHQLLAPHCRFTMAINHAARTKMLADGGPIAETMSVGREGALELCSKAWKTWSFEQYDLRGDLKARGVDDPKLLPGYHYRDDALKVWDAIAEFAGAIVRKFYRNDADVLGDFELQAWVRELADPEIGNFRGLADSREWVLPVDKLVHIVTTMIFIATAEHSSTNNGQYDMYAFIPNVPGAIFAAPPTTKAPLSEQSLFDSLPRPRTAAKQIGMVHLLSEPTETPMGRYTPSFFAGNPDIEPIVKRFDSALRVIGKEIDARNNRLNVPYPYLHPKLLYPSIEI
jgi:arachidonate 15-lipoxygenase